MKSMSPYRFLQKRKLRTNPRNEDRIIEKTSTHLYMKENTVTHTLKEKR